MHSINHQVEHVPAPDDSDESRAMLFELAKEAFFSGSIETIDAVIEMMTDGRGLAPLRGCLSMGEALVTEVVRLEMLRDGFGATDRDLHRRAEWKW